MADHSEPADVAVFDEGRCKGCGALFSHKPDCLGDSSLAAAVAEIRELHQSHRPRHLDLCAECDKGWPCPTVAILERHGL